MAQATRDASVAATPTASVPSATPASAVQPATTQTPTPTASAAAPTPTASPKPTRKTSGKGKPSPVSDDLVTAEALAEAKGYACWSATGEQTTFGDVITPTGDVEKIVLVAIRHFHCGLCQDYVAALTRQIKPEQLAAAKAKLVILGCGDWGLIKGYAEMLKTPFPIYSDPSKRIYNALGMTHRTLERGPKSGYEQTSLLGSVFGAVKNIHKWGFKSAGDIKQLGGEMAFESSGNVWCHRMRTTNDHAPVAELMQAVGIEPAAKAMTPAPATATASTSAPAPAAASAPTPTATTTPSTVKPTATAAPTEPAPIATPTAQSTSAPVPPVVEASASGAAVPQPSEPKLTPAAAPVPTA